MLDFNPLKPGVAYLYPLKTSETFHDKVFKTGLSKICGRQPLKNLRGYGLFKFFKGCLPHILLGPFLKTLSHFITRNEILIVKMTAMKQHSQWVSFWGFSYFTRISIFITRDWPDTLLKIFKLARHKISCKHPLSTDVSWH